MPDKNETEKAAAEKLATEKAAAEKAAAEKLAADKAAAEKAAAEKLAAEKAAGEKPAPGQKFLDAFGDKGALWFAQGKSFDEATASSGAEPTSMPPRRA